MDKTVVSLYSGAGGMDLGFIKEKFKILWANDIDKFACKTYSENIESNIRCGDLNSYFGELSSLSGKVDVLVGGPPCQGFSVAGKGNFSDFRNENIFTYLKVLEILFPKVFVMENVKSLGTFKKWTPLKLNILNIMRSLGYSVNYIILNASDFNVPQNRERTFFIGFKGNSRIIPDLVSMLNPYKLKAKSVKRTITVLDRAGTGNNLSVSPDKIVLAKNPMLDKSHYRGMLFNGRGRPVNINGYSPTITAFGGNMVPFIDELELYYGKTSWMEKYYLALNNNAVTSEIKNIPDSVRRLTIKELQLIQTFPINYNFCGSYSSKVRQIGNAVPCELSRRVAKMIDKFIV